MPFEVVGIHEPCLNGVSCISALNVKLYADLIVRITDLQGPLDLSPFIRVR